MLHFARNGSGAGDVRVDTFSVPDVPPSYNATGRAHWRKQAALKKLWMGTFELSLLAAGVPRPVESVVATASLRFPTRRRRDEGNFRTPIEKALGDALTNGGWLADDTPEHFMMGRVLFEEERGSERTTITIETRGADALRLLGPPQARR